MFKPSLSVINGIISENKDQKLVSIYSPSFQYGLTIFEGIRAYKTTNGLKPFLLKEHISRLLRSWKLLGFGNPPDKDIINYDINTLISTLDNVENIYIKYIVAYLNEGTWRTFETPDRICFSYKSESIFERNQIRKAKGSISSIKRISSNSLGANIKCGANYINSRLAVMDVQQAEFNDVIPIMLNENGMIAESSGSTLFIIKDNFVITPTLSSDILRSITREYLLNHISKKLPHLTFLENDIFRWDLFDADAVFLVGTQVEIIELTQIDFFKFESDNIILKDIFNEFKNSIIK